MTCADLNAAFTAAGAAAWGGVAYERLLPYMGEESREKAKALISNPAVVLTAAFPYFTGRTEGNLSVYARGADYHSVLRTRLNVICDFLNIKYPEYTFLAMTDSSPLPEREAAWLAGMGVRGDNRLFILPPYGSYVFLGTIFTDAPLSLNQVPPAPRCMACGQCRSACPTGALEGRGICLSDLTQKKGVLTAEEEALLKDHPFIWGCDLCQTACPYNRSVKISPLPEFQADYLSDLTPEMLAGLTNKEFKKKFGHRAFAWRGPAVLRRNLDFK
jgi:epoxyqueuosine reductase